MGMTVLTHHTADMVRAMPDDDFPALELARLVWHPAGAQEPFTLDLEELFRPL
jgi:hypothetical protein